jgi:hypothetical protein
MATSQQLFGSWLRARIAPVLREHGYAGSGQDFHRQFGENWAAINVQRDRYSTGAEVRFTINLGTKSALVLGERGDDPSQPVKEVDCDWRTRIGSLLPSRRDTWWSIRSGMRDVELETLGDTIRAHLVERALPELERMSHDRAILRSVQPSQGALKPFELDIAAPILRAVGPREEFERVLQEIDALDDPLRLFRPVTAPIRKLTAKRMAAYVADLGSRDWGNRSFAAMELGAAEWSEAVVAGLRSVLADQSPYVRGYASQGLGRLGDVESSDVLLRILSTDRSPHAAVGAGIGLVKLGGAAPAAMRVSIGKELRRRREESAGTHRAAFGALLTELDSPGA